MQATHVARPAQIPLSLGDQVWPKRAEALCLHSEALYEKEQQTLVLQKSLALAKDRITVPGDHFSSVAKGRFNMEPSQNSLLGTVAKGFCFGAIANSPEHNVVARSH